MPSLEELIIKEYNFGSDKPNAYETRDRENVLARLQPLPVSKEYGNDSFFPHDDVQDLVSDSVEGSSAIKNKFDRFLSNCNIFTEKYLIQRVVDKFAFPKVFGREISVGHNLTIRDVQTLLQTGLISKLDGFDNEFNLEVAKRLFSSK
jgi:hypothetical protein